MAHRFTVYIDESGDEGFTFRDAPDKGSSDWFVVSAVVTFTNKQAELLTAAKTLRTSLGMAENAVLHFAEMPHSKRVKAVADVINNTVRFCSVIVDKRSIRDIETFTERPFRIYFYAVRLLLERISWLCRDTANQNKYDTRNARIIFEHRKRLKHQDLVDYVELLKNITGKNAWIANYGGDIRIDWSVIDENYLESAQKRQYCGLQFADIIASGTRSALEIDRFGHTEHRYAKAMASKTYSHKGNYTSYGLKFFPALPVKDHSFMHWVYKHYKK